MEAATSACLPDTSLCPRQQQGDLFKTLSQDPLMASFTLRNQNAFLGQQRDLTPPHPTVPQSSSPHTGTCCSHTCCSLHPDLSPPRHQQGSLLPSTAPAQSHPIRGAFPGQGLQNRSSHLRQSLCPFVLLYGLIMCIAA